MLSAVQSLVECCISGKQHEQRQAATRLDDILSQAEDLKSVVLFYGSPSKTKAKNKKEDDDCRNLFKGIEVQTRFC